MKWLACIAIAAFSLSLILLGLFFAVATSWSNHG